MTAPMLRLQGVGKTYGNVTVMRDVTFDVARGEFIVFVGPSGCGKSTLLRMICGLEAATAGRIEIEGRLANDIPAASRGLALVFQSYALYPHMTVRQNMAFGLENLRTPKPEIERRVAEAARMLRLESLLARRPTQLSGGQRQRVAIAMALACRPKLLIADEPTTALDVTTQAEILTLLDRLVRDTGMALLFISHDLPVVAQVVERVVVLRRGVAVETGPVDAVFATPQHDYTRALVAAAAAFDTALGGAP